MKNPLLTVIVPCYNVERYLDKCISSIAVQTYLDMEILLINDGSTDNTGKICDEWQERDSRIRVIHKQNEGQSYTRKLGVERSTGAYITFVDADDWIDADMYAEMMKALLSTDSDIAQCGVCEIFEDGSILHHDNERKTGAFEVVGRIEGCLLIIEDSKWRSWFWNKIFKKSLFDNVQFYKGNGFADDFITLYLFHKVRQSVYLHDEYYNYFRRRGSTTKAQNILTNIKNHLDCTDAHYDRYLFIKQHPEYHSAMLRYKSFMINLFLSLFKIMVAIPQHFPKDAFKIKTSQFNSISLSRKDLIPVKRLLSILLLRIHPKCYQIIRKFYILLIETSNKITKSDKTTYRLLSEIFNDE